mmetsp:Transcript_20128/g.30269  ORF Transcript_20128/g.30269 Transcript_20128/m.30269 type:complete len:386 (+) Transcript_20128:103-1260(+)|eukprot:CAMPEP_0178914222 /NCGR_PEP_ID=MMETSP0786-20121207/11302_1 /TAXON_ID=186022 /ORGANISM="Thalassionema frauenfeldii, Strain CCMP 1798" /LENGTH=385 /DNA_ID=CAMNT_0020587099 /DNA_START=175 /DNA_END=1332 /DNA_ORIENTATION=-
MDTPKTLLRTLRWISRLSKTNTPKKKRMKRPSFSTNATPKISAEASQGCSSNNTAILRGAAIVTSVVIGVSSYARYWRNQRIEELECFSSSSSQASFGNRDPKEVVETLQRAGLMGLNGPSLQKELEYIQKWHRDHGYQGRVIVRELTKPLFGKPGTTLWQELEDLVAHPTWSLMRRECYYLYCERNTEGHLQQQLFCRGTTVAMDIFTCLSMWMVYDKELGCRVHWGFRNQAERILQDVQPRLHMDNGTIEVAGHSLGGAVAYIIAAKLKQRGYTNVVRVTSLASPRFLWGQPREQPDAYLRVESDADPVTLMPPFGSSFGPKLLLLEDSGKVAYIPNPSTTWVDSFFVNFRIWELFSCVNRTHRVPHYLSHIQRSLGLQSEGP